MSGVLFPGQYFDAETGLHYNGARYYSSQDGRYLTSDTTGLDGGLNTYLYANANPVIYFDPNGEIATTVEGGIIGGSIAGPPGAVIGAIIGTGIGIYLGYELSGILNGGAAPDDQVGDGLFDRPWRKPARWKVITRCGVNKQPGCKNCPSTIGGWAYGNTFREAEKRAQSDANANLGFQGFRGCQAKHCDPVQCFENGRKVKCPRGRPSGR